jgi:hypothetical protein
MQLVHSKNLVVRENRRTLKIERTLMQVICSSPYRTGLLLEGEQLLHHAELVSPFD